MGVAYCVVCLGRWGDGYVDSCTCESTGEIIYGELRVGYMRGYRDAQEGKPNDVLAEYGIEGEE